MSQPKQSRLKVYNTLTRHLDDFEPIHPGRVNMFVCGPTVYDVSHIGHGKSYVAYDIIARYLRKKGYAVFFVLNITDIDDKIINRAKESKEDPLEKSEAWRDCLGQPMGQGTTGLAHRRHRDNTHPFWAHLRSAWWRHGADLSTSRSRDRAGRRTYRKEAVGKVLGPHWTAEH